MDRLSLLDSPFLAPIRVPGRLVRGWISQALHPLRRARARLRVRALGSPRRILMVCTGNICRSPYAEARFREMAGSTRKVEVLSAGWMGPAGRLSPPEAREVAGDHGFDLSEHQSQLLDEDLVAWADLLVVMEGLQARIARERFGATVERTLLLGDLDPGSPTLRDIPDPLDCPKELFQESFDRIDRCLEELWQLLGEAS